MFTYKFLGSGGVCPLPNRDLTALYVQNQGTSLLIDCGENTQVAAKRSDVSLFNISAILLTHLHADHILGLPGLFSSFAQGNRTTGDLWTCWNNTGGICLFETCFADNI